MRLSTELPDAAKPDAAPPLFAGLDETVGLAGL
jgi:hypothetical protein